MKGTTLLWLSIGFILLCLLLLVITLPADAAQKKPNALGWCGAYNTSGYSLSVVKVKSGIWKNWWAFTLFELNGGRYDFVASYYLRPTQYAAPVGLWKADVVSMTYCPTVYR